MAKTPAAQLVSAFGNIDAMTALYAPDVEWSLPASVITFPRPMVGREAVIAFNKDVWTNHYKPDCSVEILDEVGDAERSAVRFIYRAHSLLAGKTYENEYTVFVRSSPNGITHVFEALDTVVMLDFLMGRALGESFAPFANQQS